MKTTSPQDILDKHIRKAIAPFAEQLRVEAERDRELARKAESLHPAIFEKEAAELYEKAVAGDDDATIKLGEAGGVAGYVETHSAGYKMAEDKRRHAAAACAPLWRKVAEVAVPAVSLAEAEIEAQLSAVMAELGELHPGFTLWGGRCRSLRHIFESAPSNAAEPSWNGAGWLVEQMGLTDLIGAAEQ